MSAPAPRIWRLYRDDELIAEIVATGGDFPWLYGRVDPRPGLDPVLPMLSEFGTYLAEVGGDTEARAEYERVLATLRLVTPDGHPASKFLLYIDGGHAQWRWAD